VFLWAQYAIRNAAVLAFPSWASVGAYRARGFDALGHRMLTTAATWLTLAVLLLPGLVVGAYTWSVLSVPLGPLVSVASAAACALVVAIELSIAGKGIAVLYERLDPPAIEVSH
jgi:hypothetical protein